MPNKYEREIEEILKNMDRPEPGHSLGSRIRAFNRPRPRRPRRSWSFALNGSEICLMIGIALILVGAGMAFYFGSNPPTLFGNGPIQAWIALAGFIFFVVGLVIGWRSYFRSGRAGTFTSWRGRDYNSYSSSAASSSTSNTSSTDTVDNVVRMSTRRRRNPFSDLITQFRILRLKMRYRRMRDREDMER
jgi:hypothetical protein